MFLYEAQCVMTNNTWITFTRQSTMHVMNSLTNTFHVKLWLMMLCCRSRTQNVRKIKDCSCGTRLPWTPSMSIDICRLQRNNDNMLHSSQASKPVWEVLWWADTGWQTEQWLIRRKLDSSWIADATSHWQSVFLTSKSVFSCPNWPST